MYLPFIDEGDAVALARFVDDGCRGNDGDTLLYQTTKHFPEFLTGDRVDTRRRLIEKEDVRLVDKRTTKGKFLLHASGQCSGTAFLERF